jgi:hypothetical protein
MRGLIVRKTRAHPAGSVLAKRPCNVWVKGDAGRPPKEVPMKRNDHALHAFRYDTMAIDQKVPPVESADAREPREQAERAESEPHWPGPHAEHWWTRW